MVRGTVALEGFALLTGSNLTNVATMFVTLKPWDERTAGDQSLEAILGRVNKRLGGLKEAVAFGFNLPRSPDSASPPDSSSTCSNARVTMCRRSPGKCRAL